MSEEEKTQEEQEEEAQEDAHDATVRGAQKSLGEDVPLVSESVAADPVAASSEPYKSLIDAQGDDLPDDLDDDEDEEV